MFALRCVCRKSVYLAWYGIAVSPSKRRWDPREATAIAWSLPVPSLGVPLFLFLFFDYYCFIVLLLLAYSFGSIEDEKTIHEYYYLLGSITTGHRVV